MEANTLQAKLKVSHLRIGNHINGIYIFEDEDDNGEIVEIEKTTFCTVVSLDTTESTYHPIMVESKANIESFERMEGIPLSEDILLKLGFEKKGINYELDNFRFHINKPCNYDGFVFCEGYSVITDKIQYLHQLQNLYFALTNEELTIKE